MLFLAGMTKDGGKTRQLILDTIRANPGIHPAELGKRLGFAWSTVRYHVRVLEKQNYLHFEKTEREVCIFPDDVNAHHKAMFAALREDDTQLVLNRLIVNPDLGVPELSTDLGLSQKTIRRHLSKLTGTGLATRGEQPKPLYYSHGDAESFLRQVVERRSTAWIEPEGDPTRAHQASGSIQAIDCVPQPRDN